MHERIGSIGIRFSINESRERLKPKWKQRTYHEFSELPQQCGELSLPPLYLSYDFVHFFNYGALHLICQVEARFIHVRKPKQVIDWCKIEDLANLPAPIIFETLFFTRVSFLLHTMDIRASEMVNSLFFLVIQ